MDKVERYGRNGPPPEKMVAARGDGLGHNGPPPQQVQEGSNGKPAANVEKPVVSPPPPPPKKS
jgi:hypothetical protein